MSLFTDLLEVFTPYANRIKSLVTSVNALDGRVTTLEEEGVSPSPSGEGADISSEIKQAIVELFRAVPYESNVSSNFSILESWASEISGISVYPTTLSLNGTDTSQLVATTTPAGGTVTWQTSNPAVATVSNSGLVTSVGNGTANITAKCGSYRASCAVTVSGFATLTSITASYTGGSVPDDTTLNDLRTNLTVTAHYDGASDAVISDYTLNGSLGIGENTIIVSYGGKTANFTVTVTSDALYSWDLTKSLTDSIASRVAVASAASGVSAPAITSDGIVFNAATQRLSLGEIDLAGKTIEIDIASMSFAGNTSKHVRLITSGMFNTTNGAGPLVYRATSNVGWTGYDKSASGTSATWGTKFFTGGVDAFSGKTVKLVSKTDNTRELYIDNELMGTITSLEYGSYTKDLAIGGCTTYDQSQGDQCYNMTISAIRIKNNPEEASE